MELNGEGYTVWLHHSTAHLRGQFSKSCLSDVVTFTSLQIPNGFALLVSVCSSEKVTPGTGYSV